MKKIRVTKEFTFEMAHALQHYDGKCENIHGHTYHLGVTLLGAVQELPGTSDDGMVMDFSDLKKLVQEAILDDFDHALVLYKKDDRAKMFSDVSTKLVLTDYQPTSENLLADFVSRIENSLVSNVTLHSLRLRETTTSFAEWFKEDNL